MGGSVVFDQTFGLPYADPAVQAGQTAAIAAITTAGGPGVVIGSPVLTSSNTTISSSSVSVYSLASSVDYFLHGYYCYFWTGCYLNWRAHELHRTWVIAWSNGTLHAPNIAGVSYIHWP